MGGRLLLVVLLLAGLLGMHVLTAAPLDSAGGMPAGHHSQTSTIAADATMNGGVHGGCRTAMDHTGSAMCVPGPVENGAAVIPVPHGAVPASIAAVTDPAPPRDAPRHLALSHGDLSIYRT
ncbi:hypothetical protein LK09_00570 [Microbacterium mangrovi]|uniref:Uncharacterized protein n=2 Tax=Microbacterium mangrovi TaxID=1348253 RepID=A0A0B2ADJ1_9MICO|nr:hypothetical protein LK09_00570 [Microbacterium mangrovi]